MTDKELASAKEKIGKLVKAMNKDLLFDIVEKPNENIFQLRVYYFNEPEEGFVFSENLDYPKRITDTVASLVSAYMSDKFDNFFNNKKVIKP